MNAIETSVARPMTSARSTHHRWAIRGVRRLGFAVVVCVAMAAGIAAHAAPWTAHTGTPVAVSHSALADDVQSNTVGGPDTV